MVFRAAVKQIRCRIKWRRLSTQCRFKRCCQRMWCHAANCNHSTWRCSKRRDWEPFALFSLQTLSSSRVLVTRKVPMGSIKITIAVCLNPCATITGISRIRIISYDNDPLLNDLLHFVWCMLSKPARSLKPR